MRIESYLPRYRRDLVDICYRTGYFGEDLTGRNLFNDRLLFALRFVLYYPTVEPNLTFVAVDPDRGRAVGYICGTYDTERQMKEYARRFRGKLLRRMHLVSRVRYPESYVRMRGWLPGKADGALPEYVADYPGHLHINILSDYQGRGIGRQLMDRFLGELRARGVAGVHLGTSEANYKAVPFYDRYGFKRIASVEGDLWNTGAAVRSIVFGMRLDQPDTRQGTTG